MNEKWRPILSAPGFEASTHGRIRIVSARANARWGRGRGCRPAGYIYEARERVVCGIAYLTVRLLLDGHRREFRVNRLVCEAFHGAPPTAAHHAAHWDGNSLNNRPANLYWATPQQNIDDRERHGRTMRGDRHYARKLSSADIPIIREQLAAGRRQAEIARQYGVTVYAISDIKRGKSWATM